MRDKLLLAIFGLCLWGPLAHAAVDRADDGSGVCLECHDDLPDMSLSAHASKTDLRTPSCVSCHGPSQAHAHKEKGKKQGRPDRVFAGDEAMPPQQRNEVCLGCHNSGATLALWAGSQHPSNDLACNSCHKVHTNHDKVLSKATQTEVCFACHQEQRVQTNRPSRHPIQEAKMSCSSCHNVHGSAGAHLVVRDSTNDTCYTCHAEKRGPFVHQHQPVVENCANCHNPHGSTVPAMLVARPPILCQGCHTPHGPTVGALGGQPGVLAPAVPPQLQPAVTANSSGKNVINLWQGRSCTNCHTQVHGSNNPSATNPTPQFMFR
ncbi:MAG: DmsE family decaheme c-type cytochrome [Rubrivivax sp.]